MNKKLLAVIAAVLAVAAVGAVLYFALSGEESSGDNGGSSAEAVSAAPEAGGSSAPSGSTGPESVPSDAPSVTGKPALTAENEGEMDF